MTREEAKEILRNWDDSVYQQANRITQAMLAEAIDMASDSLCFDWARGRRYGMSLAANIADSMGFNGVAEQIREAMED